MQEQLGRINKTKFVAVIVFMGFLVGCETQYVEPRVQHTYTTSTQQYYSGTGLEITLKTGIGGNCDENPKVFIDGRKVISANACFGKKTFIALPEGRHQLRLDVVTTTWAIPTRLHSMIIDFTLESGKKGSFVVDMSYLGYLEYKSHDKHGKIWSFENAQVNSWYVE